MSFPQPYKVWSCDRKTRKAVVASSLRELKQKGKEKLCYDEITAEHLRAVLESDGTEIEDDDYFKTLEKDTVFLVLLPGEEWQPSHSDFGAFRVGVDESDNPSLTLLNAETDGLALLNFLKSDIANLLLLTKPQMEQVAALDVEVVVASEVERKTMESIREACDRMLIERQEQDEKMELLRRLETQLSNADAVDNLLGIGSGEGRLQAPVFESGPQLRHLLQEARSAANRRQGNEGRRLRSQGPAASRKRRRQR